MKKILVTGGAGFIGSYLTSRLLSIPGVSVVCFDNFDPFYPIEQKKINISQFSSDPNYTLIVGDICDPLDLAMIEGSFDVIVHLAAKAGVRSSIDDPIAYNLVNHGGTQNLLEFAKDRDVKQFVFASSSSVYGANKNLPWKEGELLFPISPYASSKLSSESLGHVYSHLYGIRFIALRLFTVYGPGQRPDLAIHRFYDAIMRQEPITVYGDGNSGRDYTYVGDTVNAIIGAISYDASAFEIINIGNSDKIRLNDLISEIELICASKAVLCRLPKQAGDIDDTCADICKAKNLLGYSPAMAIKEGLTCFSTWYDTQKYRETCSCTDLTVVRY